MPVLDLASLPSGAQVFLDTNIFVYHYRGKSAACTALINRIAQNDVIGFVNTQVLSDLLHKLMLAEAFTKGYCGFGASKLKAWLTANRNLAANLTDYQTEFENTLNLGIQVLPITAKILAETKNERSQHGLMTGDSLHLGNMNRHTPQLQNIATYDGDFAHIAGLTVWSPMDVSP